MDQNITDLNPIEETDPQRRTIMLTMVGVLGVGLCGLFLIAFLWFQPGETSLFAKYFPSPTPTIRPTSTLAPTQTPAPNLTATQLAWVRPAESPSLATKEDSKNALASGIEYIETSAVVYPDTPEVNQPGDVYIFEILLDRSEPLLWSYGWCTTTKEILEENFSQMELAFIINDLPLPISSFAILENPREDGSPCREYGALIDHWPSGTHHLEVHITFTQPTNDGWNIYPAGMHTFKYIVTVND